MNNTGIDQVTLVDENDQQIGVFDKIDAHRGHGKLHRAISVFLFRTSQTGDIELLIQKRSKYKLVGALEWANTACGNVRPGESYHDCAIRRLREELGIVDSKLDLSEVEKFRYQVQCNDEFSENEIDQAFAGWYDRETDNNPKEVIETEWVSWDNLKQSIVNMDNAADHPNQINFESKSGIMKLAPWFVIMLTNQQIITKLDKWLTILKS